ncbi:Rhodanese-related sulfurtransferase [Balamuthia mandrillaris]
MEEPTKIELPKADPALMLDRDPGLEYDLGNLTAFACQPIDLSELRSKGPSTFCAEEGRDCVQLLLNKILSLPTERQQSGEVLAQLPRGTTAIPREKHIPEQKPQTRWEKFAEAKGIHKKKKDKLVWDETHKEWRRAHGYKRANDKLADTWVVEAEKMDDPYEDPFQKMRQEKKERIQKQQKREQRNRLEAMQLEAKKMGIGSVPSSKNKSMPTQGNSKEKVNLLKKQIELADQSTASVGKFNERLPSEKTATVQRGKRRFDAVVEPTKQKTKGEGGSNEKKRNLGLLNQVLGKETAVVDAKKAANLAIAKEQKQNAARRGNPRGGKGKKGKNRG